MWLVAFSPQVALVASSYYTIFTCLVEFAKQWPIKQQKTQQHSHQISSVGFN
jgi:hypothetical protein